MDLPYVPFAACHVCGACFLDLRTQELEVSRGFAQSLEEQVEEEGEAGSSSSVSDSRRRNERNSRGPPGGGVGKGPGTKAYSGQEMKKAYYEAFWRAR